MAEKKLEKGSDEWQFFQDFWKFRQKYHDSDNEPEDWYTELMNAGESIIKKYENTYFADFAKDIVFSHFGDIERRERQKHETRRQHGT